MRQRIVRGPISGQVACTPGAPVPWTTIVTPTGDRPFVEGNAEVSLRASARDEIYNRQVETSVAAVTKLKKSSPPEANF